MSSNFSFTVDTHPMANEVKGISRHVVLTTTAVTAMQMAVVSAEKEAANKICHNVNVGFYTLMQSQISQKIAKGQSDVDSYAMHMASQMKQLLAIKNKMEHDYRMITARYTKLFNSLNQNLKKRIFEIDKAVVDFAVKEVGKIANRPLNLAAVSPFMQIESLTVSQRILGSYIKNRSLKMLTFIYKFLTDAKRQKEISENVMDRQKMEFETSQIKLPAIVCENIVDSAENKNISVSIPQETLSNVPKSEMKNSIYSQMSNIQWQDESVKDEVKNEFSKLNTESSSSERVKKLALELFGKNSYQTATGASL
ncbi:MAG: hypothetical protein FWC26_13260 [Fibromonadales bacterium]|nr:hypothetical protein [Fibromonadales bacterium]